MNVGVTLRSYNRKTGPIMVTTVGEDTCPFTCPLKGAGCYAENGPLRFVWDKTSRGEWMVSWQELLDTIRGLPEGSLWRWAQAGDLPGDGIDIDADRLADLVAANLGRRGFTYTHYLPEGTNGELIRWANEQGFTVNLSANNLDELDRYIALGIAPVVAVVPEHTEGVLFTTDGNRVMVCPADEKKGVTCATCGICSRAQRGVSIAFPAHGSTRKRIKFNE